jgi:hypothetical protein
MGGMACIGLALDWNTWKALVKAIVNLRAL